MANTPLLVRIKGWLAARRLAITFAIRRARIRLAVRLARPVDGMVTSKAVYLQGMTLLAELTGRIDKSGILKGQPAKLAQIEREVEQITQAFVDAQRIGDPALQLQDVQNAYVNARIRSLPKKQRQELEHRQALINLAKQGEASGKARLKRQMKPIVPAKPPAPAEPAPVAAEAPAA